MYAVVSLRGEQGAVASTKFLAVDESSANLVGKNFVQNVQGVAKIPIFKNTETRKFSAVCLNSIENLQCLSKNSNFLPCLLF